jgi:hypothetical protein
MSEKRNPIVRGGQGRSEQELIDQAVVLMACAVLAVLCLLVEVLT